MISLALVQFLIIVLYHFLSYTHNYIYNIVAALCSLRKKAMNSFINEPQDEILGYDVALLDIHERMTISYNDEIFVTSYLAT